MSKRKNTNAYFYMQGKYGRRYREVEHLNSPFLYSNGLYKTSITEEDLPEYYIKCHSRSFWYSFGWVKIKDIKYIDYEYRRVNHLFKDDYLYISYDKPIIVTEGKYKLENYSGYDFEICGNDIITLLFAIEKYCPNIDTKPVWNKIKEKVEYLYENQKDYYKQCFGTDKMINTENYFETFRPLSKEEQLYWINKMQVGQGHDKIRAIPDTWQIFYEKSGRKVKGFCILYQYDRLPYNPFYHNGKVAEVDVYTFPEFRNQNVCRSLILLAMSYARKNEIDLIADCSNEVMYKIGKDLGFIDTEDKIIWKQFSTPNIQIED